MWVILAVLSVFLHSLLLAETLGLQLLQNFAVWRKHSLIVSWLLLLVEKVRVSEGNWSWVVSVIDKAIVTVFRFCKKVS